MLVTLNKNGNVGIIDTQSNHKTNTTNFDANNLNPTPPSRNIAKQGDTRRSLLLTRNGDRVSVLDLSTGTRVQPIRKGIPTEDCKSEGCSALQKSGVQSGAASSSLIRTSGVYCITYIMLGQAYEDCWNIN